MPVTDILAESGGIQAVARQLGISEAQASAGAAALLPAILGGFKAQALARPEGAAGLGGLLDRLGGGALLDSVTGAQPVAVEPGNGVLSHIFGSRDVSRTVAQSAAAQTGLDPALLKRMLPLLAMLVAGYLARQHGGAQPQAPATGGGGGLGDVLGGMLGGKSGAQGGGGGGGLASILDLDGDGNPLNDILGMAGKAIR